MAKENFAFLIGELQGEPKVNSTKTIAKLSLRTIRRNDKYDVPTVKVIDEKLILEVENYKKGDFILCKGIVFTKDTIKHVVCPKCGQRQDIKSTVTEVLAIDVVNIGRDYTIERFKEESNIVRILGALCRKPEFTTTGDNKKVSLCKYQIAVNRKLNVAQDSDTFTDYPWVNSFAKQAEQDAIRLDVGSQVYIDGGLQTRGIKRNITCECGEKFKAADMVTEIVPYSVEYLNHCKFDD
jgi:single-strand DNA-binding protein